MPLAESEKYATFDYQVKLEKRLAEKYTLMAQ
jgi:hypothetical protein